MRGEPLYRAAFERLKAGKAKIVDTSAPGFRFSATTVAIEAGKKKGFIRPERYPDLCRDIEAEEAKRKINLPNSSDKCRTSRVTKIKKLSEQYEALKIEHEVCLEKMLNLIRSNYELQEENRVLKRQYSRVTEINSKRLKGTSI